MTKTKAWALMLVLFCSMLGATAQTFLKLGSEKVSGNLLTLFLNWQVILGVAIYGIATALFLIAIRHGEITIMYPMIAMSYIWVSVISSVYLGEKMNLIKWGGNALILSGVFLIGYSLKRKRVRL